jgi:hypothetical protein
MNPPRYNEYEYINFLITSSRVYSCTEAARVQPEQDNVKGISWFEAQTTIIREAVRAYLTYPVFLLNPTA